MRPVINDYQKRQRRNQIITNNNYDQKSLSIFLETICNEIEVASEKQYKRRITCTSLEKIWDFSSMRLGNKSTRNEQILIKRSAFLKRINSKLIGNSMHQLKSLRFIDFSIETE